MYWSGCSTYCEPDMAWTWRVGAVPQSTMGDLDQRSTWAEQAYKDSETALYHTLGTHSDYTSALHKNIAASSQARDLRDGAEAALSLGVISPSSGPTPEQSLVLQKYKNRGADLFGKLQEKRQLIILDAFKYQGLDLSASLGQGGQDGAGGILGQGPLYPGPNGPTFKPPFNPRFPPGGSIFGPGPLPTPPTPTTDWGQVATSAGVVALVSAAVYTGWRILTKGRL